MKLFKRYNKDKEIEYLNYLINFMDNYIKKLYDNNKGYSKISHNLDIRKKLINIENTLVFSENKTISYFKKNKINNISKHIDLNCV
jgi:predicted O-linked N-acetylglucosamine transferase (SPINDLY family)